MTSSRSATSLRARRVLAGAAVILAYACGADSASSPQGDDAARAANVFTQLSDSIVRVGGDTGIASAYASLGNAIRKGFRVSPVTISVDGVPTPFMATAQISQIAVCPMCMSPIAAFPLRSFVAWQVSDPRRVVQLSSSVDGDSIRAYLTPTFAPYPGRSASLVYLDGKGGAYFGASGTQHMSVATSDVPCPSTMSIQIYPAPPTCTNAEFTVDFSAKAEPSTFLASRNTATGSHTFAMSPQSVAGVQLTAYDAWPPAPPITLPPTAPLAATLGVKVDSIATLTLTVTNTSTTSAAVLFSSGQHSDFSVYNGTTGDRMWNSSMGIFFTQIVSVDTIPAGGQRVFTSYWAPTTKGTFTATGTLVSRSHSAEAKASFSVP